MTCNACDCLQNEGGYCSCPGNISIDSDGCCDEYFPYSSKSQDNDNEGE